MAPSTRALFQEGNYFEMSYAHVSPDLEGSGGLLDPGGFGTGDVLESYSQWGFALKTDLNCCTSLAITLDQPWAVNTFYPVIPTSGYSRTLANLQSNALSGILKRRVGGGVSMYGGVTAQTLDARAAFPFGAALGLGGPYRVDAERDEGIGFLAGMAYEIEPIKFRLAATYYSEIETNHATAERVGATVTGTSTRLTTPQAINLEFQSGIAPNTLLFGGVRWVDWSKFSIQPPVFTAGVGAPLVDFAEDWLTYTVGLGRKFNEQWSLAVLFRYTPQTNETLTTLGPVDGRFSVGLAPSYTMGAMKVTAGVNWINLGDATNFAGTKFEDGHAVGVGIRTSFSF